MRLVFQLFDLRNTGCMKYRLSSDLFIQHEALAVEIRHAPPNPEPVEPAFFILIDRATFCSSMPSGGSSNDRIICSQQNLGMNIVQLAIALRSAVEYAPHYNALKQNCLWLTYTTTTLIQQHILPRNTFIIDNNEKCLFRRGKLFFLLIGSPTLKILPLSCSDTMTGSKWYVTA